MVAKVLAAILDALDAEAGPLLDGVLAPQSGLHAFNLLANAVVAEVDAALAAGLPGTSQEKGPEEPHLQTRKSRIAQVFTMCLLSMCKVLSCLWSFAHRAAASDVSETGSMFLALTKHKQDVFCGKGLSYHSQQGWRARLAYYPLTWWFLQLERFIELN